LRTGPKPFRSTLQEASFDRLHEARASGPDRRAEPGAASRNGPGSPDQHALRAGYVYAGGPGAGHFVKLAHNGVEFGMLQAIAEGVTCWSVTTKGAPSPMFSTVGSTAPSFAPGCSISWSEHIARSTSSRRSRLCRGHRRGELARRGRPAAEVPIPVITQSVVQLVASRDGRLYWARAIAMTRHGFGGHSYGPSPLTARVLSFRRMPVTTAGASSENSRSAFVSRYRSLPSTPKLSCRTFLPRVTVFGVHVRVATVIADRRFCQPLAHTVANRHRRGPPC
jgi:hypothetical protein